MCVYACMCVCVCVYVCGKLKMFLNLLPKPKVPQLSVCSKSKEGNQTLYRKVSGDDGVLICVKNNGQYIWKFLDGKIAVFFKENTKFSAEAGYPFSLCHWEQLEQDQYHTAKLRILT